MKQKNILENLLYHINIWIIQKILKNYHAEIIILW